MLTPPSLKKLFARKDGTEVSFSSEQLQDHFFRAEAARDEAYQHVRVRQQREFFIAATPWHEAKSAQSEILKKFLNKTLEQFTHHEEQRLNEFRETVACHVDTFRLGDKARQAAEYTV